MCHGQFLPACRKTPCHSEAVAVGDEGALRIRALRLPVGGRSPTWESHVKCFEFAKVYQEFKTILRDCHGRKHPRNDSLGTFLTV